MAPTFRLAAPAGVTIGTASATRGYPCIASGAEFALLGMPLALSLGVSALVGCGCRASTCWCCRPVRHAVPSVRMQHELGLSNGIVAAAANLGPIIPASGAMIVYAFMAGSSVSVGGMFMAGVVPGPILFAALMVLCLALSRYRDYPRTGEPVRLAQHPEATAPFLRGVHAAGGGHVPRVERRIPSSSRWTPCWRCATSCRAW